MRRFLLFAVLAAVVAIAGVIAYVALDDREPSSSDCTSSDRAAACAPTSSATSPPLTTSAASALVTSNASPPQASTPATTMATVRPSPLQVLKTVFPIAIDMQPATSVADWEALGINTMLRIPPGDEVEPWIKAASDAGMWQIREPRPDPADDIGDPLLIAYHQPDEPDGVSVRQIPYEQIQAQYTEWKTANPDLPVLINVTGSFNQHDLRDPSNHSEPWYQEYFAGADWLTADRYPVNLGKPILPELSQMFDKLTTWQEPERAKPWFAYIEAGDYSTESDRPSPGPTGPELRAEVWYAIIRGARGIIYFPHQVAPTYLPDVTTAEVRAEMKAQNSRITELAPVLQGEINPAPATATATAPLEIGWRIRDGDAFVIVANMSAETRTDQIITLDGVAADSAEVYGEARSVIVDAGQIIDTFAPYEVHIYQAPVG